MSAPTLTRPARTSRRAAPAVEAYAVSYDRLSRFRREEYTPEITVGNDRQHEDNAEYAARELGGIRERFTETGSASRFRTSERKRWLALLDEIRSGRVTHVLVWVLDRIIRDDADRAALIKACRESGAVIVQSGSGTVIDPDDPDSVFLATILGAVAVLEIEKMSKRIRRFKEARRDAGLPHGGKRWFGYLDAEGDRARNMQADPVEAKIYRDLVGRFLGGETLHSLAKWLDANDVPTIAGGKWTAPAVRLILLNKRYAGLVVHKGEVVGPGQWEALTDEETVDAVRRKLLDPERRTNRGNNARVYLLAGLGACAECGADLRGRPLHGSTKTKAGGAYGGRAYACATGRHVHRSVELVDRVVERLVIDRLAMVDMSGALVDDTVEDDARAVREALRQIDVTLDEHDEDRANGTITRERYLALVAKLDKRRAKLEAELGEHADRVIKPLAVLDGFVLDDDAASLDERREHARAAWEGAELGRRRALVDLLFTRVALRGGRGPFRPEQVEVEVRVNL
jgi:DNA invertase Pin-like site-specific DNA recombinase